MRTPKAIAAFTICVLSALSLPDTFSPRPVEAQPLPNYRDADCRSFVTGTYFGTISTDGNVAARSITTLTQDGNIFGVAQNTNDLTRYRHSFIL